MQAADCRPPLKAAVQSAFLGFGAIFLTGSATTGSFTEPPRFIPCPWISPACSSQSPSTSGIASTIAPVRFAMAAASPR